MVVIHRNVVTTTINIPDYLKMSVPNDVVLKFKEAGHKLANEFFTYIYEDYPSLQHLKPKYINIQFESEASAVVSVFSFTKETCDLISGESLPCVSVSMIYNTESESATLVGTAARLYRAAADTLYNLHRRYAMVPQDTDITDWDLDVAVEYLQYQMICDRMKPVSAQAVNKIIQAYRSARAELSTYLKEDNR